MTSWAPGRFDLFILGTNSLAYHKSYQIPYGWGPSQSGWVEQGGIFSQPPVAVAWGPNRLDTFALDLDSSLRYQYYDGTQWLPSLTQWINLGGQWLEKPEVVSWGRNRLDVFLIGTDNGLYHKFWDGGGWNTGFENLGGEFSGQPTAVSWESGRIDVFCTGTDSNVYHKWFNSTGWHPGGLTGGFENLGGRTRGHPKAVSWGPDRVDVFMTSVDSDLRHIWWDGSSWQPNGAQGAWENLGGSWRSVPEVVSWGPGHLDVFVLGVQSSGGSVFHKSYDVNTGQWTPNQFENLGGGVANKEIKAISWDTQRIDLFVVGTDSAVYHRAWVPNSGWFPYNNLAGSAMSSVA